MKQKFLQIKSKDEFLTNLARVLKIKKETVANYIYNDKCPLKTKEIINQAIDNQLEADKQKHILDIQVFDFVVVDEN